MKNIILKKHLNLDLDGDYDWSSDIAEYHSLDREDLSKASEFKVGFEIEKEDKKLRKRNDVELLHSIGWCKESDGSLNSFTGFELVSPVYDLYSKKLERDLEYVELLEYVNAGFSGNCGGHISVSKASSRVKTFYLEHIKAYVPLLYAMYPKRKRSDYCQAYRNDADDYQLSNYTYWEIQDSHYAVNLDSDDDRVEIRIFPAVKNVGSLLWRRDLIRVMCSRSLKTPQEVLLAMINKRSRLNKLLMCKYNLTEMKALIKLFCAEAVKYEFETEEKINKVVSKLKV